MDKTSFFGRIGKWLLLGVAVLGVSVVLSMLVRWWIGVLIVMGAIISVAVMGILDSVNDHKK